MKYLSLVILSIVLCNYVSISQVSSNRKSLTLSDVIELSKENSLTAKKLKSSKKINDFRYGYHLTETKPTLSFFTTVPAYTKRFVNVTQPDGKIVFQPIEQNYSSLGLELRKKIGTTGTEISFSTTLNQFYDFQSKNRQYNGTPFYISLMQPLFGFNEFKWRKLIEPLKYKENSRKNDVEREEIAINVTGLYFNALSADILLRLTENRLLNTETLYTTEKARIRLGTTSEDKLLQLEKLLLELKRSLLELRQLKLEAQSALLQTMAFSDALDLILESPTNISNKVPDLETLLFFSKKYRPEFSQFERIQKEKERDIEAAKKGNKQITLMISYGFNRASPSIGDLFLNPQEQRSLNLSIRAPIWDWGRSKTNQKLLTETLNETKIEIQNDSSNLKSLISVKIQRLKLYIQDVKISEEARLITKRRSEICDKLYVSGNISFNELNITKSEEMQAELTFIAALRNYWTIYYELRSLTMYDFITESILVVN